MMTDHHCIAPPRELVEQWASETYYDERDWLYELHIADRAAQWGADQELEACCTLLEYNFLADSRELRATRRPKPPTLKEQALTALMRYTTGETILTNESVDTIRRALEQLDD